MKWCIHLLCVCEKPCTQAICARKLKSLENMCGVCVCVYDFIRSSISERSFTLAEWKWYVCVCVNHYYLCIYCFAYKNLKLLLLLFILYCTLLSSCLGSKIAIIYLKCFIVERTIHYDGGERKREKRAQNKAQLSATAHTHTHARREKDWRKHCDRYMARRLLFCECRSQCKMILEYENFCHFTRSFIAFSYFVCLARVCFFFFCCTLIFQFRRVWTLHRFSNRWQILCMQIFLNIFTLSFALCVMIVVGPKQNVTLHFKSTTRWMSFTDSQGALHIHHEWKKKEYKKHTNGPPTQKCDASTEHNHQISHWKTIKKS